MQSREAILDNHDYHVSTFWDSEAEVWVATSVDVPGLATEAETVELQLVKLRIMIPELLELTGHPAQWTIKSSPDTQPMRF